MPYYLFFNSIYNFSTLFTTQTGQWGSTSSFLANHQCVVAHDKGLAVR